MREISPHRYLIMKASRPLCASHSVRNRLLITRPSICYFCSFHAVLGWNVMKLSALCFSICASYSFKLWSTFCAVLRILNTATASSRAKHPFLNLVEMVSTCSHFFQLTISCYKETNKRLSKMKLFQQIFCSNLLVKNNVVSLVFYLCMDIVEKLFSFRVSLSMLCLLPPFSKCHRCRDWTTSVFHLYAKQQTYRLQSRSSAFREQ